MLTKRKPPRPVSPLAFFKPLRWIDRTPLLDTIEDYRRRLFVEALFTFDPDGRRKYNTWLNGRAKKNYKTTDLVLTALYCFFAVDSPQGNTCFIVANDEDQAADDLDLAKKLIVANPILAAEVEVQQKQIVRKDGCGSLRILPARDAIGMHGKTYLFLGIDEMHGYRNYDVLEALAPDPTRLDSFVMVSTYDSIYNTAGAPLFDMKQRGIRGDDPRMFFSWYSAELCTDPEFAELPPEQRANPSQKSWGNDDYLEQQRRRLPAHKFRRLHLNLPGMPDGGVFDPGILTDSITPKLRQREFVEHINGGPVFRVAAVDIGLGGDDSSVCAGAHFDPRTKHAVLDWIVSQQGKKPYDPEKAIRERFAPMCKAFKTFQVVGDHVGGPGMKAKWGDVGISFASTSDMGFPNKHEIYSEFEPLLNAGRIELLDVPEMTEQFLGLVYRGKKIDHMPNEHDDWANAAALALVLASRESLQSGDAEIYVEPSNFFSDGFVNLDGTYFKY